MSCVTTGVVFAYDFQWTRSNACWRPLVLTFAFRPFRGLMWLAEICIIASAVHEVKHVWLEQLLLAESAELACSVASCMSVYTVQSSARPVVPIDRCNDWNWNWNCVPNLDNFTTARRSSQRVCQLNTTELNTQYKLSVINWTVVGRTMVTIQ